MADQLYVVLQNALLGLSIQTFGLDKTKGQDSRVDNISLLLGQGAKILSNRTLEILYMFKILKRTPR